MQLHPPIFFTLPQGRQRESFLELRGRYHGLSGFVFFLCLPDLLLHLLELIRDAFQVFLLLRLFLKFHSLAMVQSLFGNQRCFQSICHRCVSFEAGTKLFSLDMLQAGHQRGQRSPHDTANTPQYVFCLFECVHPTRMRYHNICLLCTQGHFSFCLRALWFALAVPITMGACHHR